MTGKDRSNKDNDLLALTVDYDSEKTGTPPNYSTVIESDEDNQPLFDDRNLTDSEDLTFPADEYAKFHEQISRIKWSIPVFHDSEMIKCLRAAIVLASRKLDTSNEQCQRFIREDLIFSFTKIITDDAVTNWDQRIQTAIYRNSLVFIRLAVIKIDDDCFPVMDILGLLMNPHSRFNVKNDDRRSLYRRETSHGEPFQYASSRNLYQWLHDFINKFGDCSGFEKLRDRFLSTEKRLNLQSIISLIKPWGLCYDHLTKSVITNYFFPIIEIIPKYLEDLKESDIKFDNKSESKSESLSSLIKWLRNLVSRISTNTALYKNLDEFQQKIILRLLRTNSFNGKMHALNELNKLLQNVEFTNRSHGSRDDSEESFTADKCVKWLQENEVLDLVLRDCLHQPQYVEKLDQLIRFLAREKSLTRSDLDKIWAAASGKHEAIEKNVHELLAKSAWYLSVDQLEQLFDCFRESWTKASKKQREKLLELIRRLAEDDKDGHTASKILELLWTFSYDSDLPCGIADLSVSAHLKILDCSFVHDREKTRIQWIDRLVGQIKDDRQVMLSLRHLKELCCQFSDYHYPSSSSYRYEIPHNRCWLITDLESRHKLIEVLIQNLFLYVEQSRKKGIYPDGFSNHQEQIRARLRFLRFILHDGRIRLQYETAHEIWKILVESSSSPIDRHECFSLFTEIEQEQSFEYSVGHRILTENFLQLDPNLLTETGLDCFACLLKSSNHDNFRYDARRKVTHLTSLENLQGIEFLWRIILEGNSPIVDRAIELLRSTFTNIRGQNKVETRSMHQTFLDDCFQRLRISYENEPNCDKIHRILSVLVQYINECDRIYRKQRVLIPSFRAFRGRTIFLQFRINFGQNRQNDEFDLTTHSNETWGNIRRLISTRYSSSFGVLEIFHNSELILPEHDQKTIISNEINDRLLINVRWTQQTGNNGTSEESSSPDSDYFPETNQSGSSMNFRRKKKNFFPERALPSVILSENGEHCEFLLEILEFACSNGKIEIREVTRSILDRIPVCQSFVEDLNKFLVPSAGKFPEKSDDELKKLIFGRSQSEMLYRLKSWLVVLIPSGPSKIGFVEILNRNFLESSSLKFLLSILFDENLTSKFDWSIRVSIISATVFLVKRYLICFCLMLKEKNFTENFFPFDEIRILNENGQLVEFERSLAPQLEKKDFSSNFQFDYENFVKIVFLSKILAKTKIEKSRNDEQEMACRDVLSLISLSVLVVPSNFEKLIKENFFKKYFFEMLVFTREKSIRQKFFEQIAFLSSKNFVDFFIEIQFEFVKNLQEQNEKLGEETNEIFELICFLLSKKSRFDCERLKIDEKLNDELEWLKNVSSKTNENLIRPHFNIARELIKLKNESTDQIELIEKIFENFLFPASKLLENFSANDGSCSFDESSAESFCKSSPTIGAAFSFLVAISNGSINNLTTIHKHLNKIFSQKNDAANVDFDPNVNLAHRSNKSYVGLKNPGATCYMNSVLQQLFMIRPLRENILAIQIPIESEQNQTEQKKDDQNQTKDVDKQRKIYYTEILRQIQIIFGHLLESKLQFYIPKTFWKVFKFGNELVNTREQHDAIEFFNMLVDSIDEGLKNLSLPPICSRILGGKFADQKICKDCPHRYTREEDFTLISVDIRHSPNLRESLEQYVMGELLDGPNAYFCEKCNQKVNTIKRTCFKKLPSILVIQLKRFDYDWEHETPIKFNDYFEFPRELDMEPFTVQGLAKAEGTIVDEEFNGTEQNETRYRLTGITVHMGQANGGHYYSFIKDKEKSASQWLKFDDTEVLDCRIDDDEELRSQCFGGDHTPSISDPHLPKKQRRWWNGYILFYEKIVEVQSTEVELLQQELSKNSLYERKQKMPIDVQRAVQEQNLKFLHNRIYFSPENFHFIRNLLQTNIQFLRSINYQVDQEKAAALLPFVENYAFLLTEIATKFLFSTAWKMKKNLRGSASDWADLVTSAMEFSISGRFCVSQEILDRNANHFNEYFLESTIADVRQGFVVLLINCIIVCRRDGQQRFFAEGTVEDLILSRSLELLTIQRSEIARFPGHIFQFFYQYAKQGATECMKLISLNLPSLFTKMIVDDLSMVTVRLGDMDKLFAALSVLIRSIDIRNRCENCERNEILLNPERNFEEDFLCEIDDQLSSWIFEREIFLKKLIDQICCDETTKLFRYLIWENPILSKLILDKMTTMICENSNLDPQIYLKALEQILYIQDSWQTIRFAYFLTGFWKISSADDQKTPSYNSIVPLISLINRLRNNQPKRVYQLTKFSIKFLDCYPLIYQTLRNDSDCQRAFQQILHFLQDFSMRSFHQSNDFYSYPRTGSSSIDEAISNSPPNSFERSTSPKIVFQEASLIFRDLIVQNEEDEIDDEERSSSPVDGQPTEMTFSPRSESPVNIDDTSPKINP